MRSGIPTIKTYFGTYVDLLSCVSAGTIVHRLAITAADNNPIEMRKKGLDSRNMVLRNTCQRFVVVRG